MSSHSITRRQVFGLAAALALADPGRTLAQAAMPRRPIPGTNESLPVVGLFAGFLIFTAYPALSAILTSL